MAVNYRSKQQTITTTGEVEILTPGGGVDTIIVSSIVCKYQSGSSLTGVELKINKSGDITQPFFQADFGDTSTGADYPAGKAAELLTAPMVLEDGDRLLAEIEGGGFTFFIQYAERTASAVGSTIEGLSNVSSDAPSNQDVLIYNSATGQYEPGGIGGLGGSITDTNGLTEAAPNRYMKRLDLLTDLGTGGNDNSDVLYNSPDSVHFLTQYSADGVSKVTFGDIVKSIVQVGAQTLIDLGYGTATTYTADGSNTLGDLDGDGSCTTSDLLAFLAEFGQVYTYATSNFFKSVWRVDDQNLAATLTLVNIDQWYDIPFGSTSGQGYQVDATGSQNLTFTAASGLVTIEENQVELGTQSGLKFTIRGYNANTTGLEIDPKEDGTQVAFQIEFRAFDGNGGLVSTYIRDLGVGTYNVGGWSDSALWSGSLAVTSSTWDAFIDPTVTQYTIKFQAKRVSAVAQPPKVRFQLLQVEFKKS